MASYAWERAPERVTELAGRGLDVVTFWREVSEVITPLIPHYAAPCWFTLDPASLLITSHFNEAIPFFPHESLATEYYEDDVHDLADVARSPSGTSTLHEAAGGDPSASPRWHANMKLGGDQEVIAALRTPNGQVWGALSLYREPGQPMFDAEEIGLLRLIAPDVAEGTRRGLLIGEAHEPDRPDSPGLLVLSASTWAVESATPGVERWLADLPDAEWSTGRLPAAVLSVAGQALRTSEGRTRPGEVALARVLSRSGTWVVLHGATLVSDGTRRVAVIVEPAHPARITPLLMDAYGLSEREQDVTRLVLQGESTTAIAAALTLSAHTVQQHLKSIFEKTGVRSRRDLVGKVFFSFYEPRLRDNESRAADGRPVRGGPMGAAAGSAR